MFCVRFYETSNCRNTSCIFSKIHRYTKFQDCILVSLVSLPHQKFIQQPGCHEIRKNKGGKSSNGLVFIPCFIKVYQMVQKSLMRWQTHRHDRILVAAVCH